MDKTENIIPWIIYLIISNINYKNTFNNLRFKFEIYILLFWGLEYKIFFVILMWNKTFIYFSNLTTCKSNENIFLILFYYLYLKFFISKSQSNDFNLTMILNFFLVKIFNFFIYIK